MPTFEKPFAQPTAIEEEDTDAFSQPRQGAVTGFAVAARRGRTEPSAAARGSSSSSTVTRGAILDLSQSENRPFSVDNRHDMVETGRRLW